MSSILITGGTGKLGQEISKQLINKGFEVNILSSKENPDIQYYSKIYTGDLTDILSLKDAVLNSDIIIHCASNPRNSKIVDIEGTKNLLQIACQKLLKYFIYISIVGVDKSIFPYYQSKFEVENMIQESGLPWSILRATQFHDMILDRFIKPFDEKPGSLKIPQEMQFQSVAIEDVANKLVSLSIESPTNIIETIGSAEINTIEKMTQIYLDILDRNDKIEPKMYDEEIYKLFRSGVNLCPDYAVGKITWKDFLLQTSLNI
jgi:uncharacterized protein YbjT (DUF2867 family)